MRSWRSGCTFPAGARVDTKSPAEARELAALEKFLESILCYVFVIAHEDQEWILRVIHPNRLGVQLRSFVATLRKCRWHCRTELRGAECNSMSHVYFRQNIDSRVQPHDSNRLGAPWHTGLEFP